MGKVNLEEISGTATVSLISRRQQRQTPAQATTLRRDGHPPPSAASTRIRISLRSSSGSSDQRLDSDDPWMESAAAAAARSWTRRCGLERISRIKLRKVIWLMGMIRKKGFIKEMNRWWWNRVLGGRRSGGGGVVERDEVDLFHQLLKSFFSIRFFTTSDVYYILYNLFENCIRSVIYLYIYILC